MTFASIIDVSSRTRSEISRACTIRGSPYAIALAALVMATPADAQSIADSFRQLKDSVRQLGRRRSEPVAAAAAAATSQEVPVAQDQAGVSSNETDPVPAAALVEDASDTRLEQVPVVRRRVETFDILGFKLGMSPREVGRIARRQGIRRQWNTIFEVTGSFEVEATRLANAQLNRPLSKGSRSYLKNTGGLTRDGSSILVTFTLEPSGPKLSQIDYKAKRNGMTEDQVQASLKQKYGPSDAKTSDLIWSNGATTIKGQDAGAKLFVGNRGTTVDMTLRASNDYVFVARKRLEDRAQEIARSRGGGVKF